MRKWFASIRGHVEIVVVTLLAAFMLKSFVVDAVRIPSPSMESTLLRGDVVLVNKLVYGARLSSWVPFVHAGFSLFQLPKIRSIQRGDVLVFELPRGSSSDATEPVDFVKRCVAIGGDSVQIRAGVVFVNGIRFDQHGSDSIRSIEDFGPMRVPDNTLFVLGDNRHHSYDSRFWGFLPEANVIGQAVMVYWSVDCAKSIRTLADAFSCVRWNRIGTLVR